MAETYFVDCQCGRQFRVELFQAGTEMTCTSCHATVKIPGSHKLKELSGDQYPFLPPIEKVERTAQTGEPPFDGMCHGCSTKEAAFATPCYLNVMVERHVSDEGGIRPSLTGVTFAVGEAEERWQTTTFPLLLCEHCQSRFESDQFLARIKAVANLSALLGLLIAFLYFAYHNAEFVAALSGLLWVIGAIAWAARFRNTKRIAPFVTKWIQNIRWVPEAIAEEEEFSCTIGPTIPFDAR